MYKVSVICPTTSRRDVFAQRIKEIYFYQDYKNKELVFIEVDSSIIYKHGDIWHEDLDTLPTSIGAKRNAGCSLSAGDIILHMDDDDIYAPDWITRSVAALIESKADIVGLSSCYFHNIADNSIRSFERAANAQLYMPEATLCYWRKVWEQKPFKDTSAGEGIDFITNRKLHAHGYKEGFLATIHGGNTCSHGALPVMKKVAPSECDRLLKHFYGG